METAIENIPLKQKRGRLILVLMFVFFVLPLFIVLAMHQYGWHPKGSSIGDLIEPARALSVGSQLQDASGKPIDSAVFKDKWSMVFIAEICDTACAERLYSMRQLHVALAKDIDRVQRVLITKAADVSALQTQYPDLIIINQPGSAIAELTRQFEIADSDVQTSNRIYLVDPLANLMMSYPATAKAAEIYKDMTQLLKFAWAG